MSILYAVLIPTLKADCIAYTSLINQLGYTPDLSSLRKFMSSRGFYLCADRTFRRASAIISKSGRAPTPAEREGALHSNKTNYVDGSDIR